MDHTPLQILIGLALTGLGASTPPAMAGGLPSETRVCLELQETLEVPRDDEPPCMILDRVSNTESIETVLVAIRHTFRVVVVDRRTQAMLVPIATWTGDYTPTLESTTPDSVTVALYSDYGMTLERKKHFFDLRRGSWTASVELPDIRLLVARTWADRLVMAGSLGTNRGVILVWPADTGDAGTALPQIVTEIDGAPILPVVYAEDLDDRLLLDAEGERYGWTGENWSRARSPSARAPGMSPGALPEFPNLMSFGALSRVRHHLVSLHFEENRETVVLVCGSDVRLRRMEAGRTSEVGPGIFVKEASSATFHPLPQPDLELFRELRSKAVDRYGSRFGENWPQLRETIGPYWPRNGKIYFGLDFYDGEGISGIGGYGIFDLATRRFAIHYLPAIADWSASAMLLEGSSLWMGLKCSPDGADRTGGLARINLLTHEVDRFPVRGVIGAIRQWGRSLYLACNDGVGVIRDGRLTEARFDVDRDGRLTLDWN